MQSYFWAAISPLGEEFSHSVPEKMQGDGKKNVCGDLIYKTRKKSGLSQSDLAARCNLLGFAALRETISRIERGARGVSDLELALIARALKVTAADLIPKKLPAWKKDTRSRLATDDE